MSLFKKIIFGIFIISATGLGVWAYFNLKSNKKPKIEALTVLPDSCIVYLSTSDFFGLTKKLNSQSIIADKLRLFNDIDKVCNTLTQFDSLFSSQPLLRDEVSKNSIHFALYGNELDWLAAFNIKQLGEQEEVNELISKLFRASLIESNTYAFALNNNLKLFFSISSGVVVISNDKNKINEALVHSNRKFYKNPSFIAFKNTLKENGLLSVYIDQSLYQKSKASTVLNLPKICGSGTYSGVVDIQPSELKITGYLEPDSVGIISAIVNHEPQKPDFISALPFACNYFQAFGFDSFTKLKSSVQESDDSKNAEFWKTTNDSALFNLKDAFFSNIENYLVDFESGGSRQKFVMVKISDTTLAKEHLKLLSDSAGIGYPNRIFKLRNGKERHPPALLKPFSDCVTAYGVIYESYIYFSETRDDISQLLYNLRSNMLMTENTSFKEYKNQNFPETFNYLVYDIPGLDKTGRTSFFDFATDSKTDPFENFRHFSFSISGHDKHAEFRWHLQNETESQNKEQNILWAVELDSACTTKAQVFINHISRENELLIQDESAKLYLVNAKGSILWKKQLKEKMTSQIFSVDVFKNNKRQILFSTKNQLHLLDRNGNYLPGYPLKLPVESTSPLSVFDYDNTRDYRLFIACKNNQVYNYSISGKKQEGFVPFRTDNKLRLPIQYVKVGPSDYLVALDEDGKIYTFSRKGEGRIGLKNKAVANCPAFYIDASNNINSTYFIYADDKNSLISKISFSDKKEIVKLNYDVENAGVSFCPPGEHQTGKIIFTKLNDVVVYDLNGNLMSVKSFGNDLSQTDFYQDENRTFYVSWSGVREEMLLIDPQRQSTNSFSATALPLVCDLFNDSKRYLIVTNRSRISCVLIN